MGVFVKICGMACEEDVLKVAALKPDAMGFIFWGKSPRAVTADQVAAWTAALPANILKVGVFVDSSKEEIEDTVKTAGLDVIQLHGAESAAFASRLEGSVWKAVGPGKENSADAFDVAAFLIDSGTKEMPGGTGIKANWDLAAAFVEQSATPVILAGGLSAENVAEGIATVNPWAVDVSSGVESCPGKKDLEKVKRFIEESRRT